LCSQSGDNNPENGAINNFKLYLSEFVQVAVYKLSEAGQAIDGGDFSKATSVLSQQNADWIRDIQAALDKVIRLFTECS